MGQYEKHVFVCTSGKTCKAADSAATFDLLKRAARDAGISQRVRVNHSGCMSQCGHGPMIVVYPENTWYEGITVERAQRVFDEHLVGGVPVEEFRYVAPPGDNKTPDAL
jgi:(2Fe-2S) ferredoxin